MRKLKVFDDGSPFLEGKADLSTFLPDARVKTCPRLESGVRLGPEGMRACQLGAFASPMYWSAEDLAHTPVTHEMIVEKRKLLFQWLNDDHSDISCKRCQMVVEKPFQEVNFTRLGQIDYAATSTCDLRCAYCGFTKADAFFDAPYDDLTLMREFAPGDVEWDSVVDFNGGEPALLKNLPEQLEYFYSRRVRVRFMTNGTRYRQEVYDGVKSGWIQWVCISLDAGTASTYARMKKRDKYLQVLDTITRYSHAGSFGGGMHAVKYIFSGDNCSDDDVAGFVYAMAAIRPQQIWLTYDFSRLEGTSPDSSEFGSYDFSKDIEAYAKMYCLLKKHGLEAVHYATGHLALISRLGKTLLTKTLDAIKAHSVDSAPELLLGDFRQKAPLAAAEPAHFETNPLRMAAANEAPRPWSLAGKRALLVPSCPLSQGLLGDSEVLQADLLGFIDRDPVIRGKSIEGLTIYGYESIPELNPDVILLAAPEQHRASVLEALAKYVDLSKVVVLGRNFGPAVGCQGQTGMAHPDGAPRPPEVAVAAAP